ncbi:glycosyltransferase [Rhizobium sp. 57MFTsu3.2]|uniref:glycosyltransferase family protein n=1 Tax=Rhizobium sp. 57MFTsu3.2 TaxID=1048681 RepID=UPI00146F7641|nr:glycosyltransferase [Rhizobium sp. 57MFTsu3.2]NMN68711.1 glycosyl transferase family 1 [Rhizobium sp. 57MFTsu3.2]
MTVATQRRRVLCVLPQLNTTTAPVLTNVVDEWIYALAHHCEVSVVDRDFDFKAVCDELQPDFVIFSAVHSGRPLRLSITNIHTYPEIPRALYFNCDPHDPMRPLTLSALTEYGIDTIFCFGLEHLQHMPELSQFACFVIPKFVDPEIFHDYNLEKIIPVNIMSGHLFPSFYPWRAKLTHEIQHFFPTLIYTHPGYRLQDRRPFEVRDARYAQLISQSYFSAADTTRLDYVVRKHLEIPACGTVLLAPDSDRLKEYGFVDMQNCIMGSGKELYQKINEVSKDLDLYSDIRKKGYELVHSRYTRQAWTYIADWYECRRAVRSGEVVRQINWFGKFEIVPMQSPSVVFVNAAVPDSPMSAVLRSARSAILEGGDFKEVAQTLRELSTWISHIAEPWVLLGIISLLEGDAGEAAILLSRRSNLQGTSSPALAQMDPVEIAWLLLLSDIIGDKDLRVFLLEQAKTVPHVSIRRTKWLIETNELTDLSNDDSFDGPLPGDCLSTAWIGNEDFDSWLDLMARLFRANSRHDRALDIEGLLAMRVKSVGRTTTEAATV